MLVEDLNEPVSVRADFSGGHIRPQAFRRGGRTHKISAVNAHWINRESTHPEHNFSVQAGDETYFLCLKTADMSWHLTKVIVDG